MEKSPPTYDQVINNEVKTTSSIEEVTTSQPSGPLPIHPTAPPAFIANQNYGAITESIYVQQPVNNIVVVGACPVCRIGLLEDDYSCLGICLAIFCFPLGILCCIACKNRRCTNCGAII